MLDIQWTGGSEEDRRAVAAQHEAYLQANAKLDWDALAEVFSPAEWAIYFNLNGHTYQGREHWIRLWKYYITQQSIGYWRPYDMTGVISGDLATVWCHRDTRTEWFGADEPMSARSAAAKGFVSRSTMVFRREAGAWRCVHVHFSESRSEEPRPGGI